MTDIKRKGKVYFSHDSDAHNDPRIHAMLSVYGFKGYGWYWRIIEQLTCEETHAISLSGKFAYASIASMIQSSPSEAEAFVTDCINEFELFKSDENSFWSESHRKRMMLVDEKVRKAKLAAMLSVQSRSGNYKRGTKKIVPNEELPDLSSAFAEQPLNNRNRNRNKNRNLNGKEKKKNNTLLFNPNDTEHEFDFMNHEFFSNEKFWQQWNEYMTVRDEKKIERWSDTQVVRQFNKLVTKSLGNIDVAIEMIANSSDGGWKGFWEIRQDRNNTSFKTSKGKINDAYEQSADDLRREGFGTQK